MARDIDREQARALAAMLGRLFAEENPDGASRYLKDHSQPKILKGHVNAFCWYARHLPESGAVLDWGCNHGPDSCLLRASFGEAFDLHACDIGREGDFPKFRAFARPAYQQITDIVRLPYAAETFDAVIGSGVLEHVAMDYESLREIHRVLKPGGLFVVTYYPYAFSLREWWLRRVRNSGYHQRRATLRELEILLKRAGLVPFEMAYQALLPDIVDESAVARLRVRANRIAMPRLRFPVLCALARKVNGM